MLSTEQNDRLTRIGPGTPAGELLRRYWHPVAVDVELERNPVKAVQLLAEHLTLFKDRQGRLGRESPGRRDRSGRWRLCQGRG